MDTYNDDWEDPAKQAFSLGEMNQDTFTCELCHIFQDQQRKIPIDTKRAATLNGVVLDTLIRVIVVS